MSYEKKVFDVLTASISGGETSSFKVFEEALQHDTKASEELKLAYEMSIFAIDCRDKSLFNYKPCMERIFDHVVKIKNTSESLECAWGCIFTASCSNKPLNIRLDLFYRAKRILEKIIKSDAEFKLHWIGALKFFGLLGGLYPYDPCNINIDEFFASPAFFEAWESLNSNTSIIAFYIRHTIVYSMGQSLSPDVIKNLPQSFKEHYLVMYDFEAYMKKLREESE